MILFTSVWLAFGLSVDWLFMYTAREKYKILNYKPFTCAACLSFWLTLIGLAVGWAFGVVGLPFVGVVPILAYYVAKGIDHLTNNFQ